MGTAPRSARQPLYLRRLYWRVGWREKAKYSQAHANTVMWMGCALRQGQVAPIVGGEWSVFL